MTVGKAAYSPASGKIMLRSKGLVKLSISDSQNQPKRISQLLTIAIKLLNVKLKKSNTRMMFYCPSPLSEK